MNTIKDKIFNTLAVLVFAIILMAVAGWVGNGLPNVDNALHLVAGYFIGMAVYWLIGYVND